jgi:hypothetical protein
MRVPYDAADRGSQRWIQKAVNEHANYLNNAIRDGLGFNKSEKITWMSPRSLSQIQLKVGGG